MVNLNTKYEVPDTTGGTQKLKKRWLHNHDCTPIWGYFIIRQLKLVMVSLCTKFEVPCFTITKVREGPKIQKDYYHDPIKSN